MLEWFRNLSGSWQIAVCAAAITSLIVGVIALLKSLSRKSLSSSDTNKMLKGLVEVPGESSKSQIKKTRHLKDKLAKLEKELLIRPFVTDISIELSSPEPTKKAKEIASTITKDDGLYALALKTIVKGHDKTAARLLNQIQPHLKKIKHGRNEAQVRIYLARINNAIYSGRPREALPYCKKLLPLTKNNADILNEIAEVYFSNANYKQTESLMSRALKLTEQSMGKDHPSIAVHVNSLATLYYTTNRLNDAEPLYKLALMVEEKALGKMHTNVAIRLNNLAQLYKATNRLKQAEPLLKRALEIDEKCLGETHLNVAIRLNNLAALYIETNRFEEAEPLMHRAIEISEKSLNVENLDNARHVNNLAQLYYATRQIDKAEELMVRAIRIDEETFGKYHPAVALRFSNLAILYIKTDRFQEAEPLTLYALKIDEKSLGKKHPRVAIDLSTLAWIYQNTERLKKAVPLMESCLRIHNHIIKKTGYQNPKLANLTNNYFNLLTLLEYSNERILQKLKKLIPDQLETGIKNA